ncbi:MAG: hypothetical protein PVJ89_10710 [Planctomycetota bacterium]|jgi:hypothetical protein
MDRFTAFNLIFFPALAAAIGLGAFGGWGRGVRRSLGSVLAGTVVLWWGLVGATGRYFSVLQASPDPPEEAFSDGGSLMFVLYAGWLPALIVVGASFLLSRGVSAWRRRAASR